jgi:hypothetical protein
MATVEEYQHMLLSSTNKSITWDEYNNGIRSETKLGHRPSFMCVPPKETYRGNDAVVKFKLL